MAKYRVLVVDDSRFMRQVLCDIVNRDEMFTVAGTAADGEEAVRLVMELQPDIVTLDMEMPRMNGLEALQVIMSTRPVPVIMLSAVTDNGARDTIKALQYGAFDFVRKPDRTLQLDIGEVGKYLTDKLRTAAESIRTGSLRILPAIEDQAASPSLTPTPTEPVAPATPSKVQPAEADRVQDGERDDGHAPNAPPAPPAAPAVGRKSATTPSPSAAERKLPRSATARLLSGSAGRVVPKAGPAPPARLKPPDTKESAKSNVRASGIRSGSASPSVPRSSGFVRRTSVPPEPAETPASPAHRSAAKPRVDFDQIVAIGTSTGGPRALHEVLTKLPENFEAPVLVVQHMPPKFTHSLAQRLNTFCAIRVCEAKQDERIEAATAYIAPGGKHMKLVRDENGSYRISLTTEGPRSGHMPSVDVLFESLVGHKGLQRHAVLMTGMGSDGAKGMKALKEDGATTLTAESEETCVVYGMPRSAVELGAVTRVLPLQQIGPAIVREVRSRLK